MPDAPKHLSIAEEIREIGEEADDIHASVGDDIGRLLARLCAVLERQLTMEQAEATKPDPAASMTAFGDALRKLAEADQPQGEVCHVCGKGADDCGHPAEAARRRGPEFL